MMWTEYHRYGGAVIDGADPIPDDDPIVTEANQLAGWQEQFDQRPEAEVYAERLARLFAERPTCFICTLPIASTDDAQVVMSAGRAKLTHKGPCPREHVTTTTRRAGKQAALEAVRAMFPDAQVIHARKRTIPEFE